MKVYKMIACVYEVETYVDDRRVEAVLPDYRVAFTMRQDPSNGSWLEARSEVLSGTPCAVWLGDVPSQSRRHT
jgi:hypothetical protein